MTLNRKTIIRVIALIAVIAAGWGAWTLLQPKGLPDGFVSGNGRIEAVEIDVSAKSPGRIAEILANEGDLVKQGQVLVHMDVSVLAAQKAEAEARLQQARTSVFAAESQVLQASSQAATAQAIVAQREAQGPLQTTAELASLVARVVKTREAGQNPATRTFQALRIFINAELQELEQALAASLQVLQPGGWLVVISFHSLEDRIVKQFMAEHSKEVYDRRMPLAPPQPMRLTAVQRIKPSAAEVAANPRARSAVMRVAQRTDVV